MIYNINTTQYIMETIIDEIQECVSSLEESEEKLKDIFNKYKITSLEDDVLIQSIKVFYHLHNYIII